MLVESTIWLAELDLYPAKGDCKYFCHHAVFGIAIAKDDAHQIEATVDYRVTYKFHGNDFEFTLKINVVTVPVAQARTGSTVPCEIVHIIIIGFQNNRTGVQNQKRASTPSLPICERNGF